MDKRIKIISKTFSLFLPQTISRKVDIDIKERNRSAQHASIFMIDGSSFRIQFNKFLMQAVAFTSPVITLYLLDIGCLADDNNADKHNTEKTQVHSP